MPTENNTELAGSMFQGCNLLQAILSRTLKAMEVHFTPEQEAQLAQIATKEGTDAERLVKDAALRLLEEDARFRAGAPELPILHLGPIGALHRRDIYCRVANKPRPAGNSNQP